MHCVATISSSSEASCMNHSRIARITYCHTHAHGSLQATLLRAKANSATEAKQHNIGIYPQPAFPLLLCIAWSLDESKGLRRYVCIIWCISSASASEVVGSRERVSCGASAYSMGKSFPLAPIGTFAAWHDVIQWLYCFPVKCGIPPICPYSFTPYCWNKSSFLCFKLLLSGG